MIWQAIIANPLLTGDPVGQLMIFDVVTLAYGLPALVYAGIVWLRLGPIPLRWLARILAVGFAFLWLSLEIRHAFQGTILTWGEIGEAEWYAYSAAWLASAGAGLAVGLMWRNGGCVARRSQVSAWSWPRSSCSIWPRSAACCGHSPSSVLAAHWSASAMPIAACDRYGKNNLRKLISRVSNRPGDADGRCWRVLQT